MDPVQSCHSASPLLCPLSAKKNAPKKMDSPAPGQAPGREGRAEPGGTCPCRHSHKPASPWERQAGTCPRPSLELAAVPTGIAPWLQGGMLLPPSHGHGQGGPVAGSCPSPGGGGWSCRARAAQGGEPGMIFQAEAKQERSGRGNVLSAGYQQASAAMPRHHVTSLLACLGSSRSRRQRQSCPCLVERPRL